MSITQKGPTSPLPANTPCDAARQKVFDNPTLANLRKLKAQVVFEMSDGDSPTDVPNDDYRLKVEAFLNAYTDRIEDLKTELRAERESQAKTTDLLVKLGRSHCKLLVQVAK